MVEVAGHLVDQLVEVAAGREGPAGPGDDHDLRLVVEGDVLPHLAQLGVQPAVGGVERLGPVDRDPQDPVLAPLEQQVLVAVVVDDVVDRHGVPLAAWTGPADPRPTGGPGARVGRLADVSELLVDPALRLEPAVRPTPRPWPPTGPGRRCAASCGTTGRSPSDMAAAVVAASVATFATRAWPRVVAAAGRAGRAVGSAVRPAAPRRGRAASLSAARRSGRAGLQPGAGPVGDRPGHPGLPGRARPRLPDVGPAGGGGRGRRRQRPLDPGARTIGHAPGRHGRPRRWGRSTTGR